MILWEFQRKNRIDVFILPKDVIHTLLQKHGAKWFKRGEEKTCLVTPRHDWCGRPNYRRVIRYLKESIEKMRDYAPGDNVHFPMHKHTFFPILCRQFKYYERLFPRGEPFVGDFVISFNKIEGLFKATNKELRNKYPHILTERNIGKLKALFAKHLNKKVRIFLITHIHPGLPGRN